MLNNKVEDAINAQINAEFWSAYLYLSMACNFEAQGKPGIANWFRIQFQEEQAHAQIFMNYINARGGRVMLHPIEAVPSEWETPLDAFTATLAHEEKVTALINNLTSLQNPKKTILHATNSTGSSRSRLRRKTAHVSSSTSSN